MKPDNQLPTKLPFGTSHAFIIGINDYQNVNSLSTAVNDATRLAEVLAKQHNYFVHKPLINASGAEIRNLLNQLPEKVKENDRVLFYFAGHGIALDSQQGARGYLVPADASPGNRDTLIAMDAFHDAFGNLPCRHLLLILDCCFSGAFKWSTGNRDLIFDIPNKIYQERFDRYIQDPAWQVITSSAYDQKAVDVLDNDVLGNRGGVQGQHSPFAKALFKALKGDGDIIPPNGGDGIITATELYLYLRDEVEIDTITQREKDRQTPSIFPLPKHDKGEYIFLTPNHILNLPPTPNQNPYKGLQAYNEEDSSLFYGREHVIEALYQHSKKQDFVVVTGNSGVGKSSVIKAGLLPKLRREGYTILNVIRPGREPKLVIESTIKEIKESQENSKFVLVCDQYEELLTQCRQESQKDFFVEQLKELLNTYCIKIFITIRSDFEPQFENFKLGDYWKKGRFVVPPFSADDLREVIIKPALQEVLYFEPPALVNQIVNEVVQSPGALPLLSFTLSELYEMYIKSARTDRSLHKKDYDKLGGVIGALRTRGDEVYDTLESEQEKSSMRWLMLRMLSLEGGEPAGRRLLKTDINFSQQEKSSITESVLKKLVAARLIISGQDNQQQIYYEPAHDALMRAWATLWKWIREFGEENVLLQNRLEEAVREYRDAEEKKKKEYLWNTNPNLDRLDISKYELNEQETLFIEKSRTLREKNITRRNREIWGAIVSLSVLLVIAVGVAVFAFNQTSELKSKTKSEKEANFNRFNESAMTFHNNKEYERAVEQMELALSFVDTLQKKTFDSLNVILAGEKDLVASIEDYDNYITQADSLEKDESRWNEALVLYQLADSTNVDDDQAKSKYNRLSEQKKTRISAHVVAAKNFILSKNKRYACWRIEKGLTLDSTHVELKKLKQQVNCNL